MLHGDFQVETHGHGSARALPRWAASPWPRRITRWASRPRRSKGETFATRAVAPTLATAGLGLYLGGAPDGAWPSSTPTTPRGPAWPIRSNPSALAVCHQHGMVVRHIGRSTGWPGPTSLMVDHHPAMEAPEPEVASVRVFPGHTEFQVLRYAASAVRDLEDERTAPLRAACLSRRIPLLDRIPTEYGTDVTLHHKGRVIKVGNLGGRARRAYGSVTPARPRWRAAIDCLMVGVNGQIAGLIDFRPSSRLRAAAALQEFEDQARRPLAIGLVSQGPASQTRRLATAPGRRLPRRRPLHRRPGPAHRRLPAARAQGRLRRASA